jgi:Ca2+-transporting ATPase
MIVFGTLFIYAYELSDGDLPERDQTIVCYPSPRNAQSNTDKGAIQTFTAFVFLDLVSAIQNRGLSCGLTQNRMLILTVGISFFAQLLLVYFPPLQSVFQTESLGFHDLSVLLALAGVSFSLHEARRSYERKRSEQHRYYESVV